MTFLENVMVGRSFGNDPAYGFKQNKREAEDILEAVLGIFGGGSLCKWALEDGRPKEEANCIDYKERKSTTMNL
jgi:hypothetical protein